MKTKKAILLSTIGCKLYTLTSIDFVHVQLVESWWIALNLEHHMYMPSLV